MNKLKTKYNVLAQYKLESSSLSTALLAIYKSLAASKKKKYRMEKLITFVILILSLSSCEQKINKEEKSPWEIRNENRKIAIDSLYNSMAKELQSEKDWEDFKYDYLFQLQDYFENKSGIFTIKEFYDYQIFRKDTTYYLAVRINEFSNEIFLELEIKIRNPFWHCSLPDNFHYTIQISDASCMPFFH